MKKKTISTAKWRRQALTLVVGGGCNEKFGGQDGDAR